MGVISSTVEVAKRHPILTIGGAIGIVAVVYLYSKGGSTPQTFTYSTGPSDASIQAGTQLAIAQGAQNTALAIAQLQATGASQVSSDYFGYLNNASTNSLAATYNTNAAQVDEANIAGQVANGQTNAQGYIAALQANAATQQNAQDNYTTQLQSTNSLAATESNNFTSGVLAWLNRKT